MAKCGNCGTTEAGHDIKACYAEAGKINAEAQTPSNDEERDPITPARRRFMNDLYRDIEATESTFHMEARDRHIARFMNSTKNEAQVSGLIDVLKGLRTQAQDEVGADSLPSNEVFPDFQRSTTEDTVTFTEAEKLAAAESDTTEEGLCPRCGSSGDEPCTTKNGNEASVPHAGRYAKAS